MPAKPSPIWATEEYAISDFMSCCRVQISLVIAAPVSEIAKIKGFNELIRLGIVIARRIIPNVPNLSRIPAKIIDPATGASTWAFGSHRCRKNIGALARKAINRDKDHQKFTDDGRDV